MRAKLYEVAWNAANRVMIGDAGPHFKIASDLELAKRADAIEHASAQRNRGYIPRHAPVVVGDLVCQPRLDNFRGVMWRQATNYRAAFIDDFPTAIKHPQLGMAVSEFYLYCQAVGCHSIILTPEPDEFALRFVHEPVEGGKKAKIPAIGNESDAGIVIGGDDIARIIGGGIITDQELEVLQGLLKY